MTGSRLLAGRDLALGAEGLAEHERRLGPLPAAGASVIELLIRSGLTGRGGAAYPAGLKWRSVAAQSDGTAVVIVNGAEGEPRSLKDRLLMTTRPHLILDGAFLRRRPPGRRLARPRSEFESGSQRSLSKSPGNSITIAA